MTDIVQTQQPCALCGERAAADDLVVGEKGSICVQCVWLCVDILEDRGVPRPLAQDRDEEETSAIYDRVPESGPSPK